MTMPDFDGRKLSQRKCYAAGYEAGREEAEAQLVAANLKGHEAFKAGIHWQTKAKELEAQNLALLTAIEKAAKHVKPTCHDLYDELVSVSSDLLEARDRKRDAALLLSIRRDAKLSQFTIEELATAREE